MIDYGLKGKYVVITGASTGLGQVCASAFSEEGALLFLASRSLEKMEGLKQSFSHPDDHIIFSGDLTDYSVVSTCAEAILHKGVPDVIIHAMGGGLGLREPLLLSDELDLLFRTNLGSAAELNRLIIPSMVERKKGNVIHVGSITSTDAVGSVGYNSVKASVAAYIRTLGRSLASSGVIVTGVLPGGFLAPDNAMVRLRQSKPDIYEKLVNERYPRGKMGDASEIIPLMFFLSSSHAAMMAGCCVPIDGGEGLSYIL